MALKSSLRGAVIRKFFILFFCMYSSVYLEYLEGGFTMNAIILITAFPLFHLS